jgi:hypothetical protein
VEKEIRQQNPQIVITIKDSNGDVVRRITGPAKKGFHRIAWDLRYPAPAPVDPCNTKNNKNKSRSGLLVVPGTYTATMSKVTDGVTTQLSEPVTFNVVPLRKGTLQGPTYEEAGKFWQETGKASKEAMVLSMKVKKSLSKTKALQKALNASVSEPGTLDARLEQVRNELLDIQTKLYGEKAKNEVGEKTAPTVFQRLSVLMMGTRSSTYGPTPLLRQTLGIVNSELDKLKPETESVIEKLKETIKEAEKSGIVVVE